ncbi:hypothetical protein [Marinicella sp. W31]|uniref:hypothetical protein n=1 Tax=Marinicella sp. W31 TaxID=3023713 RepID=UPI0037567A66
MGPSTIIGIISDLISKINSNSSNTKILKDTKQKHSGIGDNVAGDKTESYYTGAKFKDLRANFQSILNDISNKNYKSADSLISSLESQSNIGLNAKLGIEVLKINKNVWEGKLSKGFKSRLVEIIKITDETEIIDWCNSVLIRLEIIAGQTELAMERFEKSDRGQIVNEVYFESLAPNDEIEYYYDKNKLNCDELTLNSLYRGAERLRNSKLSLKISEYKSTVFENFYSNLFKVLSETNEIIEEIGNTHYWLITLTQKTKLEKALDNFLNLLKNHPADDERVYVLATIFFDRLKDENEDLTNFCWKNIEQIKKINVAIAAQILHMKEDVNEGLEDGPMEYIKCLNNEDYKNKLISGVIIKESLSQIDAYILARLGSSNEIKEWLKLNGLIEGSVFENDFHKLELLLFSFNKEIDSKSEICGYIDNFLQKYSNKLSEIYVERIWLLCNKLFDVDLTIYACLFIGPLIKSTKDLWNSELINLYINALLDSQQDKTLIDLLGDIDESQWNSQMYSIMAKQCHMSGDVEKAISYLEKSIELDKKKSINYSNYLLLIGEKYPDRIDEAVKNIPLNTIEQPNQVNYQLLAKFAAHNRFNEVEEIIVKWFVMDPINNCIEMNNFLVNIMVFNNLNLSYSDEVGKCLGAFHINKNGAELRKIVVEGFDGNSQYIVSHDSPLGVQLLGAKEGDVFRSGLNNYQVVSKLSPITAIHQLLLEIRSEIEVGEDSFAYREAPDDPDELLAVIEDMVSMKKPEPVRNLPFTILDNHEDPTYLVNNSIRNFLSNKVVKQGLPNIGSNLASKVLLDIDSALYLCLVSYDNALTPEGLNYYMTRETKKGLNVWLKSIEKFNLYYFNNEAIKVIFTYRDLEKISKKFTQNLKALIDNSIECPFVNVNFPVKLSIIRNVLNQSTISTIKASEGNDIEWMCVDGGFISILREIGYDTERFFNTHEFINKYGQLSGLKNKLFIFTIHYSAMFPYPLTFNELIQLSMDKSPNSNDILQGILEHQSYIELDEKDLCKLFYKILNNVIKKEFIDTEQSLSPAENIFFNKVLKQSLRLIFVSKSENDTVEFMFAILVYSITFFGIASKDILRILISEIEELLRSEGKSVQLFRDLLRIFVSNMGYFLDLII